MISRISLSLQAFRRGRFPLPVVLCLIALIVMIATIGCSKASPTQPPPVIPPPAALPQPTVAPASTPTRVAAPQPTAPIPTVLPPVQAPTPVAVPALLDVPITVRGASNLGSLQLEVGFDPQVLELKGAKAGPLARNALVNSKSSAPGKVQIGLVTTSGISGDGAVITLTFNTTGKAGSSSLIVNKVEASDTGLRDLVVSASPGQFGGAGSQASGPALSFRQ